MESTESLSLELVLITGTAGMLLLTTSIAVFIFLFQHKLIKRKIAYQQIEELLQKQELKSAYALIEGQDIERQRIAEEMHDNLASKLVTLTMYADTFLLSKSTEEQQNLVEKVRDTAQQAYEEARQLSHKLDAGILKHFGLKVAITDLVLAITESGRIHVNLELDLPSPLTSDVSLNIYRITQELINNTLKHAEATEINLNVSQVSDEYISFIYEDNGKGIAQLPISNKGMGMRNIFSRIEKLNGEYTLENKSKRGFTIIIEIPL